MSKIEEAAATLCDELMLKARSGELDCIKKTVLMLLEYSIIELNRRGDTDAAQTIQMLAAGFNRCFPTS